MEITNRMLADLAGQLGIDGNSDMKRVAEQYKGKSDAEILSEISKIKEQIKKDRKVYEQQLQAVKALRPMMNAEQRAKLDMIISFLEK